MAKRSLENFEPKPTFSPTNLSHLQDNNEFVELVWENGQIMMQGQSSRARREFNSNNSQSQIPRYRDLGSATNPKTGRYGLMGSVVDDFAATVPSPGIGLDQDDDMARWLSYDDPLHNNYSSDFLRELSSVTLNDLSHQNSISPVDKKSIVNPIFEGNQPLGVSNFISNSGYVAQAPSAGLSSASSGIINFSHFSRPVALARAVTHKAGSVANASSSGVDKTIAVNKGNFVPSGNEMGSTSQSNLLQKMVNTRNGENPETGFRKDATRNESPLQQVYGKVVSKEMQKGEKVVEPIVDSSSVCSGNNLEQASDDQNHNFKRKIRETDDSEGRSEDVEEESVGIRKTTPAWGGTGVKRSRAAEVHNLSERRRRDRINEKMRALQELIPNCNKVDKASMLDEAIEYLKTLQLQVQIMSMGDGLYLPHMMLPTGIQHGPGHTDHFPPMMGAGMGMGMGFGMGIGRFHGLRAMPFSGPPNVQMMAGPNLPVFGSSGCGTVIPAPTPLQPLVSLSAGTANLGVNSGFGVASHVENPSSAPFSIEVPNDQVIDRVRFAKGVNDVLSS